MAKKKDMGFIHMKMETNMMEIGKITKKKEKALISIMKQEKYIRVILLMIILMEWEHFIIKMEIDMKECLKMEKNMDKEQ